MVRGKKVDLDRSIAGQQITIDEHKFSYRDMFGIDEADISGEYMTQASRYAYLGALTAQAEAAYERAKADREALYAVIDREMRREFRHDKLTEPAVKGLIISDEDYMDAVDDEIDALRGWRILKSLTAAMEQRGEMLVSLGAQLRVEHDYTSMAVKDRLRQSKRK